MGSNLQVLHVAYINITLCVCFFFRSISYTDDETMSCIPLPTSASTTLNGDRPGNRPNPSPTHTPNNDNASIDINRTVTTQVQSVVTTTTPNWPQTKAVNISLQETTLIIFTVTPSIVIVIILSIVLTLLLIVAYKCSTRKKSKLLKKGDSTIHIKDTKVIRVGVDGTASQPTQIGQVSLGQGTLNRRQHVCARVASDTIAYNGQHDAASPEPEVVVMVDNNLESSCDDERYTRMSFEHSRVAPPPPSCDSHVTDPTNHLYDTIDPQPLYESVLTHSTIPKSQHSPQMIWNQNQTSSARSHSQFQNSGSPFQRSLTIGGVYSTRTTSSLHSTGSRTYTPLTIHSHRGSLTSSGAGVSQRMSGGRGSRTSHHRLSTAGGSAVSSSRAGTSTQGSMASGILPMQE